MTAIHSVYIDALLADSSYINALTPGLTGNRLEEKLSDRMTPALAKYISDNFTVVTQISQNGLLGSGFDATVWKGNSGSAYDGQVYVSMRGTQEWQDFAQNTDLALTGLAHAQLADMVNWWLRETTPTDETVVQLAVEVTTVLGVTYQNFVAASAVQGSGGLLGIGPVTSVNGHSLGGYLATAFARLFGNQQPAMEINTFNSAGYSRVASLNIENGFNQITQIIGAERGLGSFSSAQENYFAENGINVTTNTWNLIGFFQYGTRIGLYQEDSGLPGVSNHSMYKLTDLLALGDALSKLDPSFDLVRLSLLVKTSSDQMPSSYESLLDSLRTLLLGSDVGATLTGDASGGNSGAQPESRISYQQNLSDLQTSTAFTALCGQVTIEALSALTAEALQALATASNANALAYRYALKAGNPFVVLGADYAPHNQYGELDRYDPATGQGELTDQWLKDRSGYLVWCLRANAADTNTLDGTIYGYHDADNWALTDLTKNQTITVKGNKLGFPSEDPAIQVLFGTDGISITALGNRAPYRMLWNYRTCEKTPENRNFLLSVSRFLRTVRSNQSIRHKVLYNRQLIHGWFDRPYVNSIKKLNRSK